MPNLNDSPQAGLYESYSNDNDYHYDPGVIFLPLAENYVATAVPTKPLVVRVHSGYSLRRQSWAAKKKGNPPVCPAPETDKTLLGSTVIYPLPSLNMSANPTFVYTLRGQYTYLADQPVTTSTGIPGGQYPYRFPEAESFQNAAVGSNDYNLRNALGAVVGGAGATITTLGTATPDINSGVYVWPLTSIIPAGFFDPVLSTSS